MTRIEQKALNEIEALMQERQKYEKWINSLGERRSITPNHVFQRVLSDYEERMRSVATDLSGRANEIEASMNFLRERLTAIQHEEETTADERAEAELRAAVGEYTSDKWEEIRKIADENIARLSTLRMELSGELDHLGTILAVAVPHPAAPAAPGYIGGDSGGSGARGQPGGTPERSEPQRPPMARPASPISVAAHPTPNDDSFDELAFLSSVVETEISQLPSQPVDLPRNRASAEPVADRAAQAAQGSGSSKIVRSATPMISESIHSSGAADQLHTGAAAEAGLRITEEPRAVFDRRLSGSVPAYLKDVAKEASKSLKCQECGTMNYPTEWYCERCGGELAAL